MNIRDQSITLAFLKFTLEQENNDRKQNVTRKSDNKMYYEKIQKRERKVVAV